jgi:hypothetical protein
VVGAVGGSVHRRVDHLRPFALGETGWGLMQADLCVQRLLLFRDPRFLSVNFRPNRSHDRVRGTYGSPPCPGRGTHPSLGRWVSVGSILQATLGGVERVLPPSAPSAWGPGGAQDASGGLGTTDRGPAPAPEPTSISPRMRRVDPHTCTFLVTRRSRVRKAKGFLPPPPDRSPIGTELWESRRSGLGAFRAKY